VANNAGLLLIALSQAFSAFMNVSVKVLNGLDPPVAALVGVLFIARPAFLFGGAAAAEDGGWGSTSRRACRLLRTLFQQPPNQGQPA
jgi:hypothetical protein